MDENGTEIGDDGDGARARARAERGAGRDANSRQADVRDVEDRSSPRTPVIYAIVRKYGEEAPGDIAVVVRFRRRTVDQSFAAGLGHIANALVRCAQRPLIAYFGYCVGFIGVILSRQQLFTENAITAVLPTSTLFERENCVRRRWELLSKASVDAGS